MTLYKALTNFTFEEVIVIYKGRIIYQGEAWKFDLKDYWLKKVCTINITYTHNNPGAIINLLIGE